jgi:hypothetical protein
MRPVILSVIISDVVVQCRYIENISAIASLSKPEINLVDVSQIKERVKIQDFKLCSGLL